MDKRTSDKSLSLKKKQLKCSSACKSDQDQSHSLCSKAALAEGLFLWKNSFWPCFFGKISKLLLLVIFICSFDILMCVFVFLHIFRSAHKSGNIFFSVTEEVILPNAKCFIQVFPFWGTVWLKQGCLCLLVDIHYKKEGKYTSKVDVYISECACFH